MKTKKLNFDEIGKNLSRAEMKQIMAGSAYKCVSDYSCPSGCAIQSDVGTDCSDCCVA